MMPPLTILLGVSSIERGCCHYTDGLVRSHDDISWVLSQIN